MSTNETATMAVTLERYNMPEKVWGLHLLYPAAQDNFNRYPYRSRAVGLYRDESVGLAVMRENGNFNNKIPWSQLSPELQDYIVAQVVPMEWKSQIREDQALQSVVWVWLRPGTKWSEALA